MTSRPSILVLMGGPDAERPVSILSGTSVAEALRASNRFEVIERTIDHPSADELARLPGDVVFPVLHGHWGEGGPLQELLEAIRRPYVGCDPGASALAMDKMRTKQLAAARGILTPQAAEIGPHDPCPIAPPLVIKPVDDGSSVDIRICHTDAEVSAAREHLHPRRARLMVESYIAGRELTVGLLRGEPLPIIDILPTVAFYDYDAKYDRDDTRYILHPDLPPGAAEQMTTASRRIWHELGCRDLARTDFRLDADGRAWFLEINTMPGFTSHSLVPMAARAIGLEMPALCASLAEDALRRGANTLLSRVAD